MRWERLVAFAAAAALAAGAAGGGRRATAAEALEDVQHYGWYHVADPHGLLRQHHVEVLVDAEVLKAAKETTQALVIVVESMAAARPPTGDVPLVQRFAEEALAELETAEKAARHGLKARDAKTFVFVVSKADRHVKLVMDTGAADEKRAEHVMNNARYYLHEDQYENAAARALIGGYDVLNPSRARPHDLLFFLASLVVFSAAGFAVHPYAWCGLLALHVLLRHWGVLCIAAAAAAWSYANPPAKPKHAML
eukprot:TRINITY_DN2137_c0_g2_i1.p1 TRINITY_DN2137_c0_g2~~TRINITY_DN2137_c0_g2_i1.p1  ORF type:complete len:252 (+),score=89.16 TRINITY_DN2137_c0_g2_i1:227-982(+)